MTIRLTLLPPCQPHRDRLCPHVVSQISPSSFGFLFSGVLLTLGHWCFGDIVLLAPCHTSGHTCTTSTELYKAAMSAQHPGSHAQSLCSCAGPQGSAFPPTTPAKEGVESILSHTVKGRGGLSVITGLYDQIRQYFISVFIAREPGTRGTAGSQSMLSAAGSQQLCPKPGWGLMKMATCHLSDGHQ